MLFAACYRSIIILEWRDHFKHFVELRTIPSIHSAEIFDMVISENDEIYTVCPEDDYISCL